MRHTISRNQTFFRSGKPNDNAYIARIDGRLGAELLNALWIMSPADARERIGERRYYVSEDRPHTALGAMTFRAFAVEVVSARKSE
ncbi:transposase [Methylobacterium sp. WL2]|nr:transposase [Methylobacterium sp. WL1]TXN59747.1 transposase [Methylobacterium sp. WL2]